MKLIIIIVFLWFGTSLKAQNIYKGGEGSGYDMGYFSSYSLGVKVKKDVDIIIFPNPVVKRFQEYVTISTPLAVLSVEIEDLNGTVLYKTDSFEQIIDINFLSKGIYFIVFKIKNNISRKKIIVI